MSIQRKINKENNNGKELLSNLIECFFSSAMKLKSKDEIVKEYRKAEVSWMYYANNRNNKSDKKQISFIMVDAFENTILKSANKIIASKQSAKITLQMLRVLRYVDGANKLKCFIREFPFRVKYFFEKKNPSLNLKAVKNG